MLILLQQLPHVNREFARKLLEKKANDKEQVFNYFNFIYIFVVFYFIQHLFHNLFRCKKSSNKYNKFQLPTPFEDNRFKEMFTNPDFEIKETDDEYVRAKATFERTNKKKVAYVPEVEPVNLYEVRV